VLEILLNTQMLLSKTKNIIQVILSGKTLFFLLFLSCNQNSKHSIQEIKNNKIAIIDTGFCSSNIQANKSLNIKKTFFVNTPRIPNCNFVSQTKAFHGNQMLKVISKEYSNSKDKIYDVYLIDIFNDSGSQDINSWSKAFEIIKKYKITKVFSAVGYPIIKEKIFPTLPGAEFVLSSGRVQESFNDQTKLFPQIIKDPKIILVGNYYLGEIKETYLSDLHLLNKDRISIYYPFEIKKYNFKGNSLALALAAANVMKKCYKVKIRDCINKKKKILLDSITKKELSTL